METDVNSDIYNVCIRTVLDEGWIYALQLDPIVTHHHYAGPPRTVMTVRLADQAALLGLLNRLHNMGLRLLSVELCSPGGV
ncbi:MAG: hypothetical protein KDE20_06570 [Caldilineaceae bacterium]|nr:hypothetical protein [Caldilineaceae bacterium]MCB0159151.1 hypothetical protein [Caldilineaceae bacterium]